MNQTDFPNQNVPVPSHEGSSPALQLGRMLLAKEVNPTNSLRDYLSILFKHKTGIMVVFLILSVVGTGLAIVYNKWFYQPQFQAKSSILVKFGWENFSPDLSLEGRQSHPINQSDIMNSEVRILQSKELKEKVVNSIGPENIFPTLAKKTPVGLSKSQAAMLMLEGDRSKNFTVSAKPGNFIEVAFLGDNPGTAAAFVNQLVGSYIEKRTEIYKDPKSILFLEMKTEEYKQKLAESEKKVEMFRNETNIVSFNEQRASLLGQQSGLVASVNSSANQIQEVQERIAELEKQLNLIPKTAVTPVAAERAGDAGGRLLNLQLQEKELLAKYKEDNRLVTNVREQIAMVKEYLGMNSPVKGKPGIAPADPVYQDVQKQILNSKAELTSLRVRYAATQKQLGELNAEIQSFEAYETRNKELLREVSDNEEKYRNYRQRLEGAKVYDELDRRKMFSVSVVEPAVMPIVPVNPPKPLLLLIAMAFGAALAGSLALAYMVELGKQVMSTAMEVEKKLDLPVLVTIPIKN